MKYLIRLHLVNSQRFLETIFLKFSRLNSVVDGIMVTNWFGNFRLPLRDFIVSNYTNL